MPVLLKRATRILIQGITTTEGRQNTNLMLENKAEIVAGVSPGRYGQEVMGVTVYDKVSEAVKRHDIDVSVVFVPKNAVLSAVAEAIEERIPLIIIITPDIPVTETIKLKTLARKKGVTILGPGSSGILVPGETRAGSISNEYILKGEIGIITRTAGNEKRICQSLFKEEVGESAVVSLGGADIIGTGYIEILEEFEQDDNTEVVVIGGEPKGRLEDDVARYIKESSYSKPVIAYLFDRDNNPEIAIEKEKLFRDAGVTVVDDIWEIGQIIKESISEEPPAESSDSSSNESDDS
jgi:succinyl-CoA synthetase alpha subunit